MQEELRILQFPPHRIGGFQGDLGFVVFLASCRVFFFGAYPMMHVLFCGVLRLNKTQSEIHLCVMCSPRYFILFYIKLGGLAFLVFWMLKIMMDLSFVAFYVMVSWNSSFCFCQLLLAFWNILCLIRLFNKLIFFRNFIV